MDTLIRETATGRREVWYSHEYIIKQIKMAYQAGISKGIRVKFHAFEPIDEESFENLVKEFKRRVNEEYQKAYDNGEVYRVG